MTLKIKSIFSNKKLQNIFLFILGLVGIFISMVTSSIYCHDSEFGGIMFSIISYYIGIIIIINIFLIIKIIIEIIIDSMKSLNNNAKRGRQYLIIIYLFILAALMYAFSMPTCSSIILT
jgi:hypothetical protein